MFANFTLVFSRVPKIRKSSTSTPIISPELNYIIVIIIIVQKALRLLLSAGNGWGTLDKLGVADGICLWRFAHNKIKALVRWMKEEILLFFWYYTLHGHMVWAYSQMMDMHSVGSSTCLSVWLTLHGNSRSSNCDQLLLLLFITSQHLHVIRQRWTLNDGKSGRPPTQHYCQVVIVII